MDFKIEEVNGIGDYTRGDFVSKDEKKEGEIFATPNEKVFLVLRKNTIEVRTDKNLSKLLRERYESIMVSRYFGNGGVEIVRSGQISLEEIYDMVRLSYNLTRELE